MGFDPIVDIGWCLLISVDLTMVYVVRIYRKWYIWVNYNDLTATSLEFMVSKGNHPQIALIQVREIF